MLANIIRNRKKTGIGGGGGGIVIDNGDPFYSAVSMLLPMDGTNGSTTFTDSGPNVITVTAVGNAQISTTQAKYGGASAYFDGSTGFLSATCPDITGSWTMELWWYPTSVTVQQTLIACHSGGSAGINIWCNSASRLVIDNGTVGQTAFTGGSFTANQWNHVAVVRNGTTTTGYINGTAVGSNSFLPISSTTLAVGRWLSPSPFAYLSGYIDDLRITKYARYTSTFSPPTAALPTTASSTPADPYYGYTSLLLHMDGANASTAFVDSGPSALTLTRYGTAAVSTTQSKFGGASGYFDGSGARLGLSSTAIDFGTGDFTAECWIYLNATPPSANAHIMGKHVYGTGASWILQINASRVLSFLWNDGVNILSSGTALNLSQWYHIAASRSGSTIRIFINGTQVASTTISYTFSSTTEFTVCSASNDNALSRVNAYIDDLRVTKYARYTSAFAPPTQALPEYATGNDRYFSNTSLLLHMDGANGGTTFTDNSANALAVTAVGSPTTSTTQLKFGTSAAAVGGTNYLTLPNNSSLFDFGLGDFTIEFWFYYSSSQSGQIQVAVRSANQSGSLSPWLLNKKSGTNYMAFSWTSGGASWVLDEKVGTVAMTPNAWNHIAIVRRSGTFYSYINGTQDWSDSTSSTSAIQTGGDVLAIGRWPKYANSPGTYYIDDFRITKGVARYTANFTPEITAFPNA